MEVNDVNTAVATVAPLAAEPAEIKTTGKFVSAGKPQPVRSVTPTPGDNEIGPDGPTVKNSGNGASAFTDADVAAYLETKGIKVESFEKLKEKLDLIPPVEISEEQKAKIAQDKEKKYVDLFLKGGGTAEQYVAIKKVGEYKDDDLIALSIKDLKAEYKAAGFSDEQAEEMLLNSYNQISDEDLDLEEDEDDKEYLKKKKEYGAKNLASRSLHTKAQAQKILADLTKAAESEDSDNAEEKAISSKIEEQFQKMPRKLTLEIGKVNNNVIPPIEYEVSESDLNEVKAMLQNTAERNNFLYTPEGSLNISNIATVLARNKMLESAVKKAYHEGGHRQTTEVRKIFPALTGSQLGVGGSTETNVKGQKGKLVSYGKPQVSGSPQNNR